MPAPTSRHHIAELDGLRGIACGLVLLWHIVRSQINASTGILGGVHTLLSQTWSGVDLFFVLSGFVILKSLLDREDRGFPLSGFVKARLFRLVPVYVVLLAAYALCTWLFASGQGSDVLRPLFADRIPLWVYACFGQGWYIVLAHREWVFPFGSPFLSVTWSLCAEVEYYVVAALVVIGIPRNRRAACFAALALFAILMRAGLVLYAPSASLAAYVLPPARMDGFALGAVLACVFKSWTARGAGLPGPGLIFPAWLVLAAGTAALTCTDWVFSGRFAANFSYGWLAWFYTASLAWVILRSRTHPIRVLARGPLAFLGTISYSVYLFHLPLHFFYLRVLGLPEGYFSQPAKVIYLPLEIAVIVAVGTLSYLVVERPFIEWGRRLGTGSAVPQAIEPKHGADPAS